MAEYNDKEKVGMEEIWPMSEYGKMFYGLVDLVWKNCNIFFFLKTDVKRCNLTQEKINLIMLHKMNEPVSN